MEIAKAYNPKEAEENHYQIWEERGFFAPEINENPDAEPYSIVIPPPNVTGSLHMGHALQHTLMDTLTRWKRMQGYKTLFLVGIDHAGISTQLMVTRQLKKEENIKRRRTSGAKLLPKKSGRGKRNTAADYATRFAAKGCRSIGRASVLRWTKVCRKPCAKFSCGFTKKAGFIAASASSTGVRTTKPCLSDLEVKEETKKDGKLFYLQYPVKDSDAKITVATTRPETMLGDTAVAVNPEDERYQDLIGKTIELPLTNREIPIVADEYVDAEFGTGAVKITPAHDPNDYEVGLRHDLPNSSS